MNSDTKQVFLWVAVAFLVVGALAFWAIRTSDNGEQELAEADPAMIAFNQCLAEEDVTYYGAFWCPACGQQNEILGGEAVKEAYAPYVECSTPDGRGQTAVCIEAGIESYPTWEFADGSRLTGVLTIQQLSEETGCVPDAEAADIDTEDEETEESAEEEGGSADDTEE